MRKADHHVKKKDNPQSSSSLASKTALDDMQCNTLVLVNTGEMLNSIVTTSSSKSTVPPTSPKPLPPSPRRSVGSNRVPTIAE